MIKKYAPFSTNLVTGTHQCPPPPGPAQTQFALAEPGRGGRAPRDGGSGGTSHE